ncbi:uncharacterized protein BCR38DRAFT_415695 [Pseudomassariella vexata]|uniref:Uncharacterized protein n=1 Tax=Pseudomassariella vexata TaxID=1141098 RepID=A0A1Y2EHH1_9PEZI|nr:uncharacterized protein BCR38DRAFT_415695 [Pseudomassariella vexata]ORY71010.1 hypothetical protein BCR38DRAFT_415695 [Pseudomassariella vexata]
MRRGDEEIDIEVTNYCVACEWGYVDVSPVTFDKLAGPEEGTVGVEWRFIEGVDERLVGDSSILAV